MPDGLTGCVFGSGIMELQLPAQRDQVSHRLNSFLLLFFMSNMDSMPMEHQLPAQRDQVSHQLSVALLHDSGGREHVHQILWIRLVISFSGCLLRFRNPHAVQWCTCCTASPLEQLCAALLHELNETDAEGGPAASMLRLLMSVLLCFMTHGVQEKILWSINCQLSVIG